jgi:hypothetical protein
MVPALLAAELPRVRELVLVKLPVRPVRLDTPVTVPVVVTFNPPLELSANVPVVLPMATLPVPVPRFTVVALVEPMLSIFADEVSRDGEYSAVPTVPVPDILKLALWLEAVWFWM